MRAWKRKSARRAPVHSQPIIPATTLPRLPYLKAIGHSSHMKRISLARRTSLLLSELQAHLFHRFPSSPAEFSVHVGPVDVERLILTCFRGGRLCECEICDIQRCLNISSRLSGSSSTDTRLQGTTSYLRSSPDALPWPLLSLSTGRPMLLLLLSATPSYASYLLVPRPSYTACHLFIRLRPTQGRCSGARLVSFSPFHPGVAIAI